ncbi:MAG: hypothetical protein HC828_20215 [Blastochloris sp.]|nr:hypothetical protein [Blastochloris sp.]
MTTLDLSTPGELRLTLSGAAENIILTTVRRWPHWLRAELERDPSDLTQCVSVTLVAERNQESTIRDILQRSFGMKFPVEGGSRELVVPAVPEPRRRGFGQRRS